MDRKRGTFVRELKNRFLCEVTIDDITQECYVPSSSHLSNYLDLAGKEVFLREINSSKSRLKYALQSLSLPDGTEIPLEMALSNTIIEHELHRRLFSFMGTRTSIRRETAINGYKSDLYIPETKTIIEIKSILTLEKHAVFPTVYSERSIQQLYQIYDLLSDGYQVRYLFISLSPKVKDVLLNPQASEYMKAFQLCVDNGMTFRAYSIETNDGVSTIKKRIPVTIE